MISANTVHIWGVLEGDSVAVAVGISVRGQVISDRWQVTGDR